MDHLRSQLDGLFAFTAELDRRLAAAGVEGVEGALEFHRRLRAALESITGDDLDRMAADVERLRRDLGEMAARLEAIRRLKAVLRA